MLTGITKTTLKKVGSKGGCPLSNQRAILWKIKEKLRKRGSAPASTELAVSASTSIYAAGADPQKFPGENIK